MPTIVAYLDVLGFSSYTERDLAGAIGLLKHQQFILDEKLADAGVYQAAGQNITPIAQAHLVDSFLHFLPGSDSTFLVSNEPDKFVRQFSNFLIECLQLVGHAYADPYNVRQPEVVQIKDAVTGRVTQGNWFPPLWGGGLATGTLQAFRVKGIENRNPVDTPNLVGTAIVKAVRATSTARGPRLFCEAGFERNFGVDIQPFFRRVNPEMMELLWPAFAYLDGDRPDLEIQHFDDLWGPGVGLWKSKKGHRAFEHYDEFLRLLIRSAIAWGNAVGFATEIRELVSSRIRDDIGEDLIEAYLN